jgi:hypothetical protein
MLYIIIQLSIKLPLLGGIKQGAANMRVPASGPHFPDEPKIFRLRDRQKLQPRLAVRLNSGVDNPAN